MVVSDTIIAAAIGAAATLIVATVQVYGALRWKNKVELRPKRGSTLRSVVSIIALMSTSAVGGFIFSELRQQRTNEDMRILREELNTTVQTLAATTARFAELERAPEPAQRAGVIASAQAPELRSDASSIAESAVYAAPCKPDTGCDEAHAERLTLCGFMPSTAKVGKMDFFIAAAGAQDESASSKPEFKQVDANQDVGGAKFVAPPSERRQGEALKTVCSDLVHWSEQGHFARVVLHYEMTPEAPEHLPIRASTMGAASSELAVHPASLSHTDVLYKQ